MKANEFIIERVLNLHTPEEKAKYADLVWNMLQQSYAKIGGFKGAASKEELVNTPGYWKLYKRGNDITALNIYKGSDATKNVKSIASAAEVSTDPATGKTRASERGIRDYDMLKRSDVKTNRSWAEVSGSAEKFLEKIGSKPLSNRFAELLTGKKVLDMNPDGIHYTRLIQGHPHEKVIYGFANLTDEYRQKLINSGIDIQTLPDNIK